MKFIYSPQDQSRMTYPGIPKTYGLGLLSEPQNSNFYIGKVNFSCHSSRGDRLFFLLKFSKGQVNFPVKVCLFQVIFPVKSA